MRFGDAEEVVQMAPGLHAGKIVAIHAVVDQVNPIRGEACTDCVQVSVLANNREVGESEQTNLNLTHGHAAAVNRCHGWNARNARPQARKQVRIGEVRMQELNAMYANKRQGELECFPVQLFANRRDIDFGAGLSEIIRESTFERTQTKNPEVLRRESAYEV